MKLGTRTAVGLGAAALAALAVLAVTNALWVQQVDTPLTLDSAQGVGFSVQRTDSTAQTAADGTDALALTLTVADVETMMSSPVKSLALPIKVKARADGSLGLNYSVPLPTFTPGTVLANSTIRLWALPATVTTDAAALAACTTVAAPATQPSTTNQVALPTGGTVNSATLYWCLTAVYSGTGGTYTNTVTATSGGVQVTSAQDSWTGYRAEPVTFNWTHEVTAP